MTRSLGCALVLFLLVPCAAAAQEKTETAPKPNVNAVSVVPLRVQVVIARYEGEKRVSSFPYTLSLNGAQRGVAQVRMGAEVPISGGGSGDDKAPKAVSYSHVGTQIDCVVRPTDDGRHVIELSINEKSVYAEGEGPKVIRTINPVLRSFGSSNTVILKTGESTQFTAAADRITGEIVRVEVTLQAAK